MCAHVKGLKNLLLIFCFREKKIKYSNILDFFCICTNINELHHFLGNGYAEIVTSFTSEVMFYIGLAIFLQVTDLVQKPYLQFSAKRWSLITGLKGYLTSAYFAMGIKLSAPVFAACATWPIIRFPAVVSVAPFLAGCLAQFVLESRLENRGSSSWPLVPIIFEVHDSHTTFTPLLQNYV